MCQSTRPHDRPLLLRWDTLTLGVVIVQEESEIPACFRLPFTGKLVTDTQTLFGMLSDVARAPSRLEKEVGLHVLCLLFLAKKWWTIGRGRNVGNLLYDHGESS